MFRNLLLLFLFLLQVTQTFQKKYITEYGDNFRKLQNETEESQNNIEQSTEETKSDALNITYILQISILTVFIGIVLYFLAIVICKCKKKKYTKKSKRQEQQNQASQQNEMSLKIEQEPIPNRTKKIMFQRRNQKSQTSKVNDKLKQDLKTSYAYIKYSMSSFSEDDESSSKQKSNDLSSNARNNLEKSEDLSSNMMKNIEKSEDIYSNTRQDSELVDIVSAKTKLDGQYDQDVAQVRKEFKLNNKQHQTVIQVNANGIIKYSFESSIQQKCNAKHFSKEEVSFSKQKSNEFSSNLKDNLEKSENLSSNMMKNIEQSEDINSNTRQDSELVNLAFVKTKLDDQYDQDVANVRKELKLNNKQHQTVIQVNANDKIKCSFESSIQQKCNSKHFNKEEVSFSKQKSNEFSSNTKNNLEKSEDLSSNMIKNIEQSEDINSNTRQDSELVNLAFVKTKLDDQYDSDVASNRKELKVMNRYIPTSYESNDFQQNKDGTSFDDENYEQNQKSKIKVQIIADDKNKQIMTDIVKRFKLKQSQNQKSWKQRFKAKLAKSRQLQSNSNTKHPGDIIPQPEDYTPRLIEQTHVFGFLQAKMDIDQYQKDNTNDTQHTKKKMHRSRQSIDNYNKLKKQESLFNSRLQQVMQYESQIFSQSGTFSDNDSDNYQ